MVSLEKEKGKMNFILVITLLALINVTFVELKFIFSYFLIYIK